MDKLQEAADVDDSCKFKVKGKWRWQCNLCEKHYATKYSLQTHKVGHSGLKPFECLDCGKAFKQLSHLNTHKLRHAGLRPHCCTVCEKRFVQSSHLKRHMNTHNPEKALYCDICSRKFTYPSEVRSHKEKMHGPNSMRAKKVPKSQKDVTPIVGPIDLSATAKFNGVNLENVSTEEGSKLCQKAGPKRKATNQDIETETFSTNSPQWLCNQCPLTFHSQNALIAHMASPAHQDQDTQSPNDALTDMAVDDNNAKMVGSVRRWQCKKCQKTYASKYGLITHMSDHIGTKPFQCKVCQRRFKQLSHLNTHRLRHEGLRPHSCNVCGKSFVQRSHLKRHIHTHTSVGAYFCDWCPRKFTYPSELRLHTEKMHSPGRDGKVKDASSRKHVNVVNTKVDPKPEGATVMICPECGKSFNYQSQLDKHMKRHTNIRPHICKECGMQFMEIHHLNQHAFTHTGLKPYKCLICSRGFALEANMRRHFLIHSGVRAFECHLCRRRFAQKQTLAAHMIVHSDKKPHLCKFCGKAFRRNHNLICHLRLHNDAKPYKCLSCGLKFNRKGNLRKHQKDKHYLDPEMDFIHFKALHLPDDNTLVNSLNNTKDLHDVIDNLDSGNGMEESTESEAGDMPEANGPGIKKEYQHSEESSDGQRLNDTSADFERSKQSISPDLAVGGAASNVGNNDIKPECHEKEHSHTLEEIACKSTEHVVGVGGQARVAKSEIFDQTQVVDSVENSNQSLTDNVLLQEGNSMGDNFMFNREPVEGSNIFEEELKWETDLGLVQQEEEMSSSEELDSIVNEPRTMVSKYYVKGNLGSKVTREVEEKAFVPGILASPSLSEFRVSKRKGTPRQLKHSIISSAPVDNYC